jgi:multidrug resistance efflux pump
MKRIFLLLIIATTAACAAPEAPTPNRVLVSQLQAGIRAAMEKVHELETCNSQLTSALVSAQTERSSVLGDIERARADLAELVRQRDEAIAGIARAEVARQDAQAAASAEKAAHAKTRGRYHQLKFWLCAAGAALVATMGSKVAGIVFPPYGWLAVLAAAGGTFGLLWALL